MTSRLLSTTVWLALLATPACLVAQNVATSANEDERIEALLREQADFYRPKSSVSVGFRMLSSGANVKFGNLGIVKRQIIIGTSPTLDQTSRQYDNGFVLTDLPTMRADEGAATTVLLPGGRYQTEGLGFRADGPDLIRGTEDDIFDKVPSGDFLSYQAGLTRTWRYDTDAQATDKPGYIAMNSYSTRSDGASFEKDQGANSGVEMQYARLLRRLQNKRFEINLVAGIALNGINNKTAGEVKSTLLTTTDYYSLNGQAAPAVSPTTGPYTAPTTVDFTNSSGDFFPSAKETTTAISETPATGFSTVDVPTVGTAVVQGNWQVKGAYFMMRLGPSFRAQLTERLGLNAGVGLAGAYVGTRFTAVESFTMPNDNLASTTDSLFTDLNPGFSDKHKLLGGYYADVNMEWLANETTGLFGGVSAQKFGGYDQELGGRTARIDLGSSVGIRGGVSIKF